MTHQMGYPCGCVNALHDSGVWRCESKCDRHRARQRDPKSLAADYYAELGASGETAHVREMNEAMGPLPVAERDGLALEIGCGASPYAGAIKDAGWRYHGLDASAWAADWTARKWGVDTTAADWEDWTPARSYGLIVAAHVLEHVHNAPSSLRKMADALRPGGELRIIVPDDSDPLNPDHLWFFAAESLEALVSRCGLVVASMATRRIVRRENFLYLVAHKPTEDRCQTP